MVQRTPRGQTRVTRQGRTRGSHQARIRRRDVEQVIAQLLDLERHLAARLPQGGKGLRVVIPHEDRRAQQRAPRSHQWRAVRERCQAAGDTRRSFPRVLLHRIECLAIQPGEEGGRGVGELVQRVARAVAIQPRLIAPVDCPQQAEIDQHPQRSAQALGIGPPREVEGCPRFARGRRDSGGGLGQQELAAHTSSGDLRIMRKRQGPQQTGNITRPGQLRVQHAHRQDAVCSHQAHSVAAREDPPAGPLLVPGAQGAQMSASQAVALRITAGLQNRMAQERRMRAPWLLCGALHGLVRNELGHHLRRPD